MRRAQLNRAGQFHHWETTDIARDMVLRGHALDYPRYSQGAYADDQEIAEGLRAGVWAGEFQRPWEWRLSD
ncbi:hypothetical protein GCM10009101_11370 [Brevundimonas lenta]